MSHPTRPLFDADSDTIIALLAIDHEQAVKEAEHRSNRKVVAALAAYHERQVPTAVQVIDAEIARLTSERNALTSTTKVAARVAKSTSAKPAPEADDVEAALKVVAREAYAVYFDAAPEGSKRYLGKLAYRTIMRGETLESVEDELESLLA